MRNKLRSRYDEKGDDSRSNFYWWRSAKEFDEEGHLKIDVSNISNLPPRLKVLREMERLALMAPDSFDDLRHKLMNYRSGDFWVPTGGLSKDETEIPAVITILLVGFAVSGKSSLINLMYSVLGRTGLIPFAQTSGNSSNYRTTCMEEHNVLRSTKNGFCVYDTRGFDYDRMAESMYVLSEWMADGVRHLQPCCGAYDDGDGITARWSSKFVRRRVNSAVVVASLSEIYKSMKAGDIRPMEATRELFHSPAISKYNEQPILILTHGDMLSTDERLEGRIKICEFLGVSETTGAYDIACLTEYGILVDESDSVTAYTLTEAVYRALLFADRDHPPKRKIRDWLLMCLSWLMCALSSVCAFLAYCFSKVGEWAGKNSNSK